MRQKKFWFTISGILAVLAMALMLPTGAVAASKYKVLHKFTGGADGSNPYFAGLIFDANRNLYGTTAFGGTSGDGTVFKLKPNSDGSWTESVLYSFSGGTDGIWPYASLTFDVHGNLYGTTTGGGSGRCGGGCGTVFKLKPNSDGSWTEKVLYSFHRGADGAGPGASLIFDAAGNLYGTTAGGGSRKCYGGCGTVFRLKPNSDGSWTEKVLYKFTGGPWAAPLDASLIFDAAGNLYGATPAGEYGGAGTVFKLTPNSDGSWTESVLYSFTGGADGWNPTAGLIFDAAGNLYGTTTDGGAYHYGTVFELMPNSDGSWRENVLHHFKNHPAAGPWAGVTFDAAGNLYGTTYKGGPVDGGVVFKLTPHSGGSWRYSVLHTFLGKAAANPYAGVVLDNAGNLFGTTRQCGSDQECQGVVFEITP
jgi:uncharacterized repeat protein (TIGR03803 family)